MPSALLAKRVIVGEGATEAGFIRYSLNKWDSEREDLLMLTAVTNGCVATDGGGDSQAPKRATALAVLGYPTFLMVDGDVDTNADAIAAAAEAGVELLRWPNGKAFEDVVVDALDWPDLQSLVELAAEEISEEAVRATVGAQLGAKPLADLDIAAWRTAYGDDEVRTAIAWASKGKMVRSGSNSDNKEKSDKKAWFKRQDRGERLARLVFDVRLRLDPDSDLVKGLQQLKVFATPVNEATGSDESA
jgi:hypothetical protein